MILVSLVCSLLSGPALAQQSFELQQGFVLEAESGTFYENGVGSPSVVWDEAMSRYVMFFETRTGPGTDTCIWGPWAIGVATSPDGANWTVWPDPVIAPKAGSSYQCVVAHPAAVLEDGTYHVWFKSHQGQDACADGDKPWGCGVQSGVGYATGTLELLSVQEKGALIEEDLADTEGQLSVATDTLYDLLIAYEDTSDAAEHDARDWWDDRDIGENLGDVIKGKHYGNTNGNSDDNRGNDQLKHILRDSVADIEDGNELDLAPIIERLVMILGFIAAESQNPEAEAFAIETLELLDVVNGLVDLIPVEEELQDLIDDVRTTYAPSADLVVNEAPVVEVIGFGYPTVVNIDGRYHMLIAKVPDFYLATSSEPGSGWVMELDPVMIPGGTGWSRDELYNPSMVCEQDRLPFTLFYGGRNITRWIIDLGGWGEATSGDSTSWFVDTEAHFTFAGAHEWRHWDVTRVGNDYLVWYSAKDAAGRNRVGLAGTTDTWTSADVASRGCDVALVEQATEHPATAQYLTMVQGNSVPLRWLWLFFGGLMAGVVGLFVWWRFDRAEN